jgi:hypothetical protein
VTTLTLVVPYVPVLVVLAVTAVELLRGRHIGPVGWTMVFALSLLVLGRQLLNLWDRAARERHAVAAATAAVDASSPATPDGHPALTGR